MLCAYVSIPGIAYVVKTVNYHLSFKHSTKDFSSDLRDFELLNIISSRKISAVTDLRDFELLNIISSRKISAVTDLRDFELLNIISSRKISAGTYKISVRASCCGSCPALQLAGRSDRSYDREFHRSVRVFRDLVVEVYVCA